MKQRDMSELDLDFRPLEFRKTSHNELRPPIFDGDHTYGDDFGAGQLLSLHHAKKAKALLFVVRFTAGPDAATAGWHPDDTGEVEFLLMEKQGRYVGTITRQAPEGFCSLGMDKFAILDGLGHGPGGGGRRIAHFFCSRYMSGFQGLVHLTVTVYIRRGWFGGWKEIVVKVPKKDLYVALP